MFYVARELHMTIAEIKSKMGGKELSEWIAFFRILREKENQ